MGPGVTTVGGYLASRLASLGIREYFAVPGDYNLALLDEFLKNDDLALVGCCNELNAGYAADGYARATGGLGLVVVTFSVGAYSALNAVAGAFAEDLPVVIVSGAPNTNSAVDHEVLHHTIGGSSFEYQRDTFAHVTEDAVSIDYAYDAPYLIDRALATAVRERKPVYIEVAANLATHTVNAPEPKSFRRGVPSDPETLAAAVECAAEMLNAADKPVLVGGVGLRSWGAIDSFAQLASAAGYAVANMPDAKGFVSEALPGYIGTYWGTISDPGVGPVIESADAYLFAGPVFTDYSTGGHSALVNRAKLIEAGPHSVRMPGRTFSGVELADFLDALAGVVEKNATSLATFARVRESNQSLEPGASDTPISTRQLASRIQAMLTHDTTLIVETGDSWFNAMKMRLPEGCRFEIQMKYGSIGWSVGAALGYAAGVRGERTVVAMIGDGSFQMTAQELSTLIRQGLRAVLFVINNGGYTIEVEIHDGPYNVIQTWAYADLVDVFAVGGGKGWGTKVETEGELDAAIAKAADFDGVSLVEVVVDRDDCSKELLEWGSRVVANNARPPQERAPL